MRKTINKKTIPVVVFSTFLFCGVILTTCAKPEDIRDTYLVSFVATYIVKEQLDTWGNWEKEFESTPSQGDPSKPWNPTPDEADPESWIRWKTVEIELPPIRTDTLGRLSRLPKDPEREEADGYYFDGWFTSGGMRVSTVMVFTADTTVFAKWKADATIGTVEDGPVAKKFKEIRDALDGQQPLSEYRVDVEANETILAQTLYYGGVNKVRIILSGNATNPPIITLTGMGNLFSVGRNVILELRNIWLQGGERNSHSLLSVNDGGELIIGQSALDKTRVYNNMAEDPKSGGGVTVNKGGNLVMYGGEIYGNTSVNRSTSSGFTGGGGVLVRGGTFTMNNGRFEKNGGQYGGGVMVYGGRFTLEDGEFFDNVGPNGGGVFVYMGLFEMNGGKIHGNTASNGGGVYVARGIGGYDSRHFYNPRKDPNPPSAANPNVGQNPNEAINDPARKEGFYFSGGEISDNGAAGAGGGLVVDDGAFAYMTSGKISGNSARSANGVVTLGLFIMMDGIIEKNNAGGFIGGVDVMAGRFIMHGGYIRNNEPGGAGAGVGVGEYFLMHGGEISGNRAGEYGGGIYIRPSGSFAMAGGKIFDNSATRPNSGTFYFPVNTTDSSVLGTAFYGISDGDNIITALGEWKEEVDEETGVKTRTYEVTSDFDKDLFKADNVSVELKNGTLTITSPDGQVETIDVQ